jgi:hypothetical protein
MSLKKIENRLIVQYIEELESEIERLELENVALIAENVARVPRPDYPEINKAELEREVDVGLGLPQTSQTVKKH